MLRVHAVEKRQRNVSDFYALHIHFFTEQLPAANIHF